MQYCCSIRHCLPLFFIYFALQRSNGCTEMQQLIHSLPYVSLPDTKCLIGNDCSSLQCTSTTEKATFSVGFAITCNNDPTIELNANIPTSGIISWHATFNDQTEKVIPGYFFPTSKNQTVHRQGYLKVSLKSSERDSFVLLSLTLKGCENIQEIQAIDYSCTQKQIISNQQLACGKGKSNNQQKFCSLFRPFECSTKETCSQIDESEHGECQCVKGYARDKDGTCSTIIAHPEVAHVSTASLGRHEFSEMSESIKDPAALAVNIVVPLLVLILVAALLYAAYKHGLIHQCLVRLCGRTTETVLVMDDDDSPLA